MLTTEEIRTLLQLCQLQTVAEFDSYRVVKQGHGWEGDYGPLMAKLSIMLEIAHRREDG